MCNLFRRSIIGLVAVALSSAGAAWAQDDDVYGEQLLPPETRLMFSIPSVPYLIESGSASSMGQLLADPDFQPLLDQVRSKLNEASEELKENLGVTLEDLWTLPQGEITFAIVEKPARKLNAVLMIDYGDNQDTMDTLLEKMDAALKDNGGEHETKTVDDVEIEVYTFPSENENPYNRLAYFVADGYFVASSDIAPLEAVLNRWDGDGDDSLADSEVFQYILEKCSTGDDAPAMTWYLDLMGLIRSGVAMVQGQQPQAGLVLGMLPILGLDRLKGMGGGFDLGVDDFDSVSKAFIYVEQPASGILGVFQFPAVRQEPPKWVSADVSNYMSLNWNVSEAYLAVESVIDSFQGPGAFSKVLDAAAMDEDGPGIHPKSDILDYLSGGVQLAVEMPEEVSDDAPAIPQILAAIGLKDADAMKRTLAKAAESDGFPGRTRDFEGQTIYELPTESDQILSVAIIGKDLMMSSTPEGLEGVIRGDVRDSLAKSDEYRALAKHFPAETSIITYQHQSSQLKSAYELLKNLPNDEIEGFDLSVLPDFEAVEKYAKAAGGYVIPDKKGALFVGFTLAD